MVTTDEVFENIKNITDKIEKVTGKHPQSLHNAVNLMKHNIPDEIERKIRFLATIRNKLAHESNFGQRDIPDNFLRRAQEVIEYLDNEFQGILRKNPGNTLSFEELIALADAEDKMEVSTTPDPEPAESLKPASAKNSPEPDESQEKIQEEETEVWIHRLEGGRTRYTTSPVEGDIKLSEVKKDSLKPASAKNSPEPDEPQEKIQEEETEVWEHKLEDGRTRYTTSPVEGDIKLSEFNKMRD